MEPNTPEDTGLDIEAAAADIASDLFNEGVPIEREEPAAPVVAETPAAPVLRQPPSSWAKEHHERWTRLDPDTQSYIELREKQMLDGLGQYKENNEFGRAMREAFAPYKQVIAQQGLDEVKAMQVLMGAHMRLSSGSPEERASYFQQLAKNYGIQLGGQQTPTNLPPEVAAIDNRLQRLEGALTQREQKQLAEAQQRTAREVTDFAEAKDEQGGLKHPHFDECADYIALFIGQGKTLDEAYRLAVRANPVTYEKEVARLKAEAEREFREKATKEAAEARKATGSNVRGRDTRRAPTEPVGTMDDTMKETLAGIKARPH